MTYSNKPDIPLKMCSAAKDPLIRDKKIRALETVRIDIERGKFKYLCYALDAVAKSNPVLRDATIDLRYYIMGELGIDTTLEQWYLSQHGTTRSETEFRTYRVQWIDWMLASLREESK